MGLAFFGLTFENSPQFRVKIFKQIHDIVFYGNGGYSWSDVYNMPIWLRNFTYDQIQKYYNSQNKESNDSNKKTLISPDGKINKALFPQVKEGIKPKSSYK